MREKSEYIAFAVAELHHRGLLSVRAAVTAPVTAPAARPDGVSVILRGSPGVGKSSILRHLAGVTAAGGSAITLSGSELGTSVPLGAFLPLLDADALRTPAADTGQRRDRLDAGPVELLSIADAARRAARNADLLVVDDVHLLDPASAGLIHQLASAGTAVLLAARRDEPLPAALEALWRNGGIRPVEIEPFTERETAALLQSMLSGLIDAGLARAMFDVSAGNALYLRELIRAGLDQRAIVCRRDVWVLDGSLPVAGNLTALLRQRFAGADDEVKFAAELVAVMDTLHLLWAQRRSRQEHLRRCIRWSPAPRSSEPPRAAAHCGGECFCAQRRSRRVPIGGSSPCPLPPAVPPG
ncbi:MAG: AAA family ATPase [Microbacteriaceae bacterium]